MQGKRLSIGLTATLAIFAVAFFSTGSAASKQHALARLPRNAKSPPSASGKRTPIQLLEFCILGFGLPEYRNVRVSIFPERKKVLIRLAGGRLVAHHHLCASEMEAGQRSR
jgi:hypothetical protein